MTVVRINWQTLEGSLPGMVKELISPSSLTPANSDKRRMIFSANPKAEALKRHFGLSIMLLKAIQEFIDPETTSLEIIHDPDLEKCYNILCEVFGPEVNYLGEIRCD